MYYYENPMPHYDKAIVCNHYNLVGFWYIFTANDKYQQYSTI